MSLPPSPSGPRLRSLVRQRGFALLVAAGTGIAPLPAQTRASLGVGIGTVRTEGGSSFSSANLSPVVRYTAPNFVLQGSGFVASLPAGVWAGHGRLYFWGATPRLVDRWRLGVEGILTGTTFSDGSWTSAAHGLGELVWSSPSWGFGLGAGPSTGWIANDVAPRFVALHTRERAWWRPGGRTSGTEWAFAAEPTHFVGAWFTDLSASVALERGPAVLSLATDARVSSVYGSTGAGSAFLQLWVAPTVSLELGGGSYLREPYQGFPRGGFVSIGVRIGATRPAARGGTARRWAPLLPERRGDSLVVHFRFPGVRSVAIAGDWNGWTTVPLRSLGGDLWEGTLALARGLYHFNILVDGHDWVVPSGVATVPDGLGGMVAVLLVR
jgi:hypothetical protein